jgi:hypothetical protein
MTEPVSMSNTDLLQRANEDTEKQPQKKVKISDKVVNALKKPTTPKPTPSENIHTSILRDRARASYKEAKKNRMNAHLLRQQQKDHSLQKEASNAIPNWAE